MEQVFFNVPLFKLEPIFKRWIKEVHAEMQPTKVEPTNQPEILTVKELSKFLNLQRSTIYGYVHKKKIPFIKRGKVLYFERAKILEWLRTYRQKTADEIQNEIDNL